MKKPNARAEVLPAAGFEAAHGRRAGVHEGPHYAEVLSRVPSPGEARLAVAMRTPKMVFISDGDEGSKPRSTPI
jgi:hypothetical protein